jgi:hypothetical protein
MTYPIASALLPALARTQGWPALVQFAHEGTPSSHRTFWLRHRAHAVPFLRPAAPACCCCCCCGGGGGNGAGWWWCTTATPSPPITGLVSGCRAVPWKPPMLGLSMRCSVGFQGGRRNPGTGAKTKRGQRQSQSQSQAVCLKSVLSPLVCRSACASKQVQVQTGMALSQDVKVCGYPERCVDSRRDRGAHGVSPDPRGDDGTGDEYGAAQPKSK